MKKLMFLVWIVVAIGVAGCGLKPGLDYKPDGPSPRPMYKNLDHLWFSWYGYSNPTTELLEKSQAQEWWGTEIPYIPAK